ncbi:glutathione S-transferase family protein [Kozakia baliensis]|uniref:Glutathione S-transferase n=1 Tax=Kozakia baliensis TaxID=153496 RepID=A0A1D8UYN4_9PROT|nr:glutathione S-transferase N-terminal domain-containing protein [Kozakia baliensis]AOX18783.1 glutathione S-transferase [Kozakia baliensis]GBR33046.1 glutathione S-transferase [Kozakia baliensis NRIC 0488]GEL65476.1 thiol:disulfide oxidoreductase [Kozakia baliensis]
MFDVYAFATPNSVKVPIALEELGLPYTLRGVNVRKGEQKTPAFLKLNPNGKVPSLVDTPESGEPFVLTESAAILVYLAEKTGRLLPVGGAARARVFEQLFFHASGLSPAFGQSGFFQRFAAEPQPLAIERFSSEANRTLGLLDSILARNEYVAGEEFTIADIAHFGWLWRRGFPNITFSDAPHVARWYEAVEARPAVQRGIARVEALVPQD